MFPKKASLSKWVTLTFTSHLDLLFLSSPSYSGWFLVILPAFLFFPSFFLHFPISTIHIDTTRRIHTLYKVCNNKIYSIAFLICKSFFLKYAIKNISSIDVLTPNIFAKNIKYAKNGFWKVVCVRCVRWLLTFGGSIVLAHIVT